MSGQQDARLDGLMRTSLFLRGVTVEEGGTGSTAP